MGAMPTGNSVAERAVRKRARDAAAAKATQDAAAAKALAATRGRGGGRDKGRARGPSHSPPTARSNAGAGAVGPIPLLPDLVPFNDIGAAHHGLAGTIQDRFGCAVSATIMLMLAGLVAKGVPMLAPSSLPPSSGSTTSIAAALHAVLSTFTPSSSSSRTRSSTTNTGVTEKAAVLRRALGCQMVVSLDVVGDVLVPLLDGLHSGGCLVYDGSFVAEGVGCLTSPMPLRAHEVILSAHPAKGLAQRQQSVALGEFISYALVNHRDASNMVDFGCTCGEQHYLNTWWAEQPRITRSVSGGDNTRLLFVQLTGTDDHEATSSATAAARVWKRGLRWEGEFDVQLPIDNAGVRETNHARVIGVIYHHPNHWTACIRGYSAWHYHDDSDQTGGNIVEVSSHANLLQDPIRSSAAHRRDFGWEAHVILLALTPVVAVI